MKAIKALPVRDKDYRALEREINRIYWEVIYKPVVHALEVPKNEVTNAKAPLYIRRPIVNADEIIAWAKEQGFKNTLKPDDLHVTICHSRAGVEGNDIEKAKGSVVVSQKSGRHVTRLGDKGAVVLLFQSSVLQSRWLDLIEKHGASWDYESYQPHITITYDSNDIDVSKIKPFPGLIVMGDEIHERLVSSWRTKITELLNAQGDSLDRAIAEGTVYFENGLFKGNFSAAISKDLKAMGATFNPKSKTWSYAGVLPAQVSVSIATSDMRYTALRKRVLNALDNIDIGKIDRLSRVRQLFGIEIEALDKEFKKAVKSITIPPNLTPGTIQALSADWSNNLDLYIKNWAAENILKLRQQVQDNAFAGRRASSMVHAIQQNYGVSKNKAKFLARQETSLLVSKYNQSRFQEIGSYGYRWSGAMDERERPDHKALEGEIFSWSEPPVVDLKTGRRCHPGEDYGCRCVPIALFN